MLDTFRIKFHKWKTETFGRVASPPQTIANPYHSVPRLPYGKINPYITDYPINPKKPFVDVVRDMIFRKKESETCGYGLSRHGMITRRSGVAPVAPTDDTPSFLSDIRVVFFKDVLFLASKMRLPKRVEHHMSSEEIADVCARMRW